jgi:hypothetical protein
MFGNTSLLILVFLGVSTASSAVWGNTGALLTDLSRHGPQIVKADQSLNLGLRAPSKNLALRGGERQYGLRYTMKVSKNTSV